MTGQYIVDFLLMVPLQWSTGWLLCSMPGAISVAMWLVSS